jgi:chemotaxis protein methyltransferase CheR
MNNDFFSSDDKNQIINDQEFNDWIVFTKNNFQYDFSEYAPASLKRRLSRILSMFDLASVTELQQLLAIRPAFFAEILPEITVGVTELFRDPPVWKYIRSTILPILAQKPVIRIWHAGCSTGEEVYTMSILLSEAGLRHKAFQTATDLNPNSIAIAKNGLYSFRKLDIYQKNYNEVECVHKLTDYYKMQGANVQMNKSLLTNVSFQEHNLVSGDVLGSFDLILCRNVLIYFDNLLQDKVLNLFQRSLEMNGILVVGLYESLMWCTEISKFAMLSTDYNVMEKRSE